MDHAASAEEGQKRNCKLCFTTVFPHQHGPASVTTALQWYLPLLADLCVNTGDQKYAKICWINVAGRVVCIKCEHTSPPAGHCQGWSWIASRSFKLCSRPSNDHLEDSNAAVQLLSPKADCSRSMASEEGLQLSALAQRRKEWDAWAGCPTPYGRLKANRPCWRAQREHVLKLE